MYVDTCKIHVHISYLYGYLQNIETKPINIEIGEVTICASMSMVTLTTIER
jgi:hypothetical protein